MLPHNAAGEKQKWRWRWRWKRRRRGGGAEAQRSSSRPTGVAWSPELHHSPALTPTPHNPEGVNHTEAAWVHCQGGSCQSRVPSHHANLWAEQASLHHLSSLPHPRSVFSSHFLAAPYWGQSKVGFPLPSTGVYPAHLAFCPTMLWPFLPDMFTRKLQGSSAPVGLSGSGDKGQ